MRMVRLLDTSGKNETDAIVTDSDRDTNTDTKPSYAKEHYSKNRKSSIIDRK